MFSQGCLEFCPSSDDVFALNLIAGTSTGKDVKVESVGLTTAEASPEWCTVL